MDGRDRSAAWFATAAPSLDDIEAIAETAYRSLPESIRELTGEIVFQIADYPDESLVEELELESEFELLGIFQGMGIAHASPSEPGQFPNTITLFRRAILDYWSEHTESLGAIVSHVLVHEIGHHFGLSDEDMERIEADIEDVGNQTISLQ